MYYVCTLLDYTSPVLVRDVALSAIRTHHQTTPAQRGRSIVLLQANTRNINPPSVRSPQQREVLLWPFIQTKKYYTFPLSPPLRTYSVQCTVHLFPRAKFMPVLCGGVYIAKRLEGKKEYHRDHSSTNLPWIAIGIGGWIFNIFFHHTRSLYRLWLCVPKAHHVLYF